MTAQEATDKVENLVRKMLVERFQDNILFKPIIVKPRVDHDGVSYLHTYIVFDGDQELLDPVWTLRLTDRLWPYTLDLGFPGVPVQSFVEKSEWDEWRKEGQYGPWRPDWNC